jgi:nitrite reductase/ring-hydroxylating ferredoxin subunit
MSALHPDSLASELPCPTRPAPLLSGWPAAWFMFCPARAVRRGPVGKQAFGQRLVAFRTASGKVAVLAGGCVVGESLRCPFHHWQFDAQGRCIAMPATGDIPEGARQLAFPAVERMGGVYCYNGRSPAHLLPFFDGLDAADLQPAPPCTLVLQCPWYMVGANGVDVQHFATTHDRRLLAPPAVDYPLPDVHRTVTRFGIAGQHLRDRLTRLAGHEVRMEVHDWSGTMFLVRATFRRTETFGIVSLLPRTARETEVHVIVAVRRSSRPWCRRGFDPLNARLRRWFIQRFLQPDVARSAGTDVATGRLIPADRPMAEYFRWLQSLHGVPS